MVIDLTDIITSIITGILAGIVSSIIIYILVFKIKPKISISNQIAKSFENDKYIYRIKIVNKSKFDVFNVDCHLYYCYTQEDGIVQITEISPIKTRITHISRYNKKDEKNEHAVRLSFDITEEYETQLKSDENAFFQFTVAATHGFTNTSTHIEKKYLSSDIKNGRFETGNSMIILSGFDSPKIPLRNT